MRFSSFSAALTAVLSLVHATSAVTDTCANVQGSLTYAPGAGMSRVTVGAIQGCICLSNIPSILQTNPVAIATVSLAGVAATRAQLIALINSSPKVPMCPTAIPPSKRNERGYIAARASCPGTQMVCGIYGGSSRAWECVNAESDLESCGGCMFPLLPSTPEGQDCSAIPHVADVACISGICVVGRCLPGFHPSDNGKACEPDMPATVEARQEPTLSDAVKVALGGLW